MSIATTTRKAGPFAGNSIQTVFPFVFKVFAAADLLVVRATAGVETTLTLGVDYTVILNGDQDAAPGGSITLGAALATGSTMVILSNVLALQQVVVTNGGGFFPAVFNGVFDRLTILIQQLAEKVGRGVLVPATDSASSLTLPTASSRANTVLAFDGAGLPIAGPNATDIANASGYAAAAAAARDAAIAVYDSFDDRYLGVKPANPTTDNDGNALVQGTLYFNSVALEMRVYNGAAWVAAYVPAATYALASDLVITNAAVAAALLVAKRAKRLAISNVIY